MINTNIMASFMPQSSTNMFEMGRQSGPFAGANSAVRQGLAEWKAQQAAAQEQQNKIGLITHEYGQKKAMYGQGGADPDASGPTVTLDPTTGKYFYRNTTLDANGAPKVSWSPVSPMAPETPAKRIENAALGPVADQMEAEAKATKEAALNPIQQAAMPQPTQIAVQPIVGQGKPIDANTARLIMKQAGGDPNKARAIAKSQGYQF